MSYCKLGITCTSNTIAYTSNNKFIPFLSPVYLRQGTYMMQYPGDGSSPGVDNVKEDPDHEHPNVSKAFYGKIFKRHTTADPKKYGNDIEKTELSFNLVDYDRGHSPNHEHVNVDGRLDVSGKSCKNC